MKILLLTQWFEPEPTFKGLLFAKALKEQGHDVEVLTGFPNYPGGNVYDGYQISWYLKEEIDGVTVHRVALYPSHDGSPIKRIFNYVSFAISSSVLGLIKTRNIDIIYSYHPPLTTCLSALILSFFKKVPFVIDVQDLWPDTLAATGMLKNEKLLDLVGKFCQLVYKSASRIVVLSPGFKDSLTKRGVPPNKIEVIYNWCNEPALFNYQNCEIKLPDNGNRNILFAGNLGYAQGLPAIINASEILSQRQVKINIVLLGDGLAKNQAIEMSKKKRLDNIFFLPRVSINEVGGLLIEADILLVHLNDEELFRITIPSRTQANLAVGKPIIMAVSGDASQLVMQSGGGITCRPNSPNDLADAVQFLSLKSDKELAEMGNNSQKFYFENLSLIQGVKKFIKLFEEVV